MPFVLGIVTENATEFSCTRPVFEQNLSGERGWNENVKENLNLNTFAGQTAAVRKVAAMPENA